MFVVQYICKMLHNALQRFKMPALKPGSRRNGFYYPSGLGGCNIYHFISQECCSLGGWFVMSWLVGYKEQLQLYMRQGGTFYWLPANFGMEFESNLLLKLA